MTDALTVLRELHDDLDGVALGETGPYVAGVQASQEMIRKTIARLKREQAEAWSVIDGKRQLIVEGDERFRIVAAIAFHLAQLRHLYEQMANGRVRDTKGAADGLLAPAIRCLEELSHD